MQVQGFTEVPTTGPDGRRRQIVPLQEYLLPKHPLKGPLPHPRLGITGWVRRGSIPPLHIRIEMERSPVTYRYYCDAMVCSGHLIVEAPQSLSAEPLLVEGLPRCYASPEEAGQCFEQHRNMQRPRALYIQQFAEKELRLNALTVDAQAQWWLDNTPALLTPLERPPLPPQMLGRAQPSNGPVFQPAMPVSRPTTMMNGQSRGSSSVRQRQLATPQSLNNRPKPIAGTKRPNGQSFGASAYQQGLARLQKAQMQKAQMLSKTSMPPPQWQPALLTTEHHPQTALPARKRQRLIEPEDDEAFCAGPSQQKQKQKQKQQQQQQLPTPVSLARRTPLVDPALPLIDPALPLIDPALPFFDFDAAALPIDDASLQMLTAAGNDANTWADPTVISTADNELLASSWGIPPVPQQRWLPGKQTAIVDDDEDEGVQGPSIAGDGVKEDTRAEAEQGAVSAADNGLSAWSSLFEPPAVEQAVSSEQVLHEEEPDSGYQSFSEEQQALSAYQPFSEVQQDGPESQPAAHEQTPAEDPWERNRFPGLARNLMAALGREWKEDDDSAEEGQASGQPGS